MARSYGTAIAIGLLSALLGAHCTPSEKPAPPVPATPITVPVPPTPTPVPPPPREQAAEPTPAQPDKPALEIAAEPAPGEAPAQKPLDIYSGAHKLGVNRVTDMARTGIARFSTKGGALQLEGRVARGEHWLELSGRVEPDGPSKFVLIGSIRGVPDMSWANQAPRERNTEGRFTFEIRKGRPYFRMYGVNGRECVCDDGCGNDFCYIDIEQMPIADVPIAK